MKTIAPAAMDAIAAGEAIVTGAVEIIPVAPPFAYEAVDVVDIDAVANGTGAAANGPSVGITLSGLSASDVLRITLPAGQAFTAWNYQVGTANRWLNEFDVIPDGVVADSYRLSQAGQTPSSGAHFPNGYATPDLARRAFATHYITGATQYCFYILDTATGGGSGTFNNSGGVSVKVDKRLSVGGDAPDPIRLWGGYGVITIDGVDYQPLGDRGLAQQTAGALGGVAQGLTMTLSSIEAAALALLDADEIRAAAVVMRRLIFGPDGKTLLGHEVWDRGRVDTVETDETVGGPAAIVVAVESAARGLGRGGARQRSDSDQRLIKPDDGYFKSTAFAGQKTLYWGGKKPARGGAATRGSG
jgi:hypothetical protein